MTKKVVALLAVVIGAFSLVANAQGVTSINTNARIITPLYLNYMMGTVSLPTVAPSTNNTNLTPVATTTATTTVPTNTIPAVVNSTSTCVAYLTTFHKYGDKGADVAKLQLFLNKYNGANLNGKGVYGPATAKEVQNLQYAYGIKTTGAQYQKTTDLINKLNCGLIEKKPRVVFAGQNTSNTVTVKANTIPAQNIYPNAPQSNIPTGNINKVPTKPVVTNKNTKIATSTATVTDAFGGSFKNDFDRIKENYKAYILVFVLVLALFWFLRKAATE